MWIAGQSVAEHAPESSTAVAAIVGALTDTARYRNLEHEHIATMANATNAQRLRSHNVDARREELDHFVDALCRQLRTPLETIASAASTLHKDHARHHGNTDATADAAMTTLDAAVRKMVRG